MFLVPRSVAFMEQALNLNVLNKWIWMKDYVGEAYTRQKRLQLCSGPYATFSAEVGLLLSAHDHRYRSWPWNHNPKCSLVSGPDFLTLLQVSICLYLVTEAGKLLNLLEATWQTLVEMAGGAIVWPQPHFIFFRLWQPLHFQFCGSIFGVPFLPAILIDSDVEGVG